MASSTPASPSAHERQADRSPPRMTKTLQSVTDSRTFETRGGDSCPASYSPSRLHLDLFSGIGGFALAANAAGYKTIGFSEIEPYACKILKRHWPDVPNYGDIRNVRGIRCELLTGGFPCQPFSLAGKQRGAKDDRHLWPEMCRVIAEARPSWVLGENVPGIIGMELDNVLADLEHLGYACWPIVVPACAVDARHRRDRVWIVAYAAGVNAGARRPGRSEAWTETPISGSDVADTHEAGRREQRRAEPMGTEHAAAECGGENVGDTNQGRLRRGRTPGSEGHALQPSRWQPEPGMGRVVDGLPNRSHRLKGLGNAIVPQVAETLIRMMARMENEKLSD